MNKLVTTMIMIAAISVGATACGTNSDAHPTAAKTTAKPSPNVAFCEAYEDNLLDHIAPRADGLRRTPLSVFEAAEKAADPNLVAIYEAASNAGDLALKADPSIDSYAYDEATNIWGMFVEACKTAGASIPTVEEYSK